MRLVDAQRLLNKITQDNVRGLGWCIVEAEGAFTLAIEVKADSVSLQCSLDAPRVCSQCTELKSAYDFT